MRENHGGVTHEAPAQRRRSLRKRGRSLRRRGLRRRGPSRTPRLRVFTWPKLSLHHPSIHPSIPPSSHSSIHPSLPDSFVAGLKDIHQTLCVILSTCIESESST